MELTQVRLLVDDFGSCFRFYRDVLGLTPQTDDDSGPYGKLSPPVGGAAVTLQERAHFARELPAAAAAAGEGGGGVRALVVLKVDRVDAAAARIRAGGHSLLEEPRNQWGRLRVAYLTDPEGNLVELQEWLTPGA
ncbi:VOC family protein [Kitasatospora sp. NBC_00315]|uniref:VOC family protein n=1 Tax=Kitasatospora sp. NBC_00315 TaxID=2975963 RepID=UPI00324FF7EE